MNLLASLAARGAGLPLVDAAASRPEKPSSAEAVPLMTGPVEAPSIEETTAPATPPFPDIDQLSAEVRDRALAEIRALQPPPAVPASESREATAFLRPPIHPEPPPLPAEVPPEIVLSERVVEIVRTESPTIVQQIVERELLSASPAPPLSEQQPLLPPADRAPERRLPDTDAQKPQNQPELVRAPDSMHSIPARIEASARREATSVTEPPVLSRVDGQPVLSIVSAEPRNAVEPGTIQPEVPRPRVLRSKEEIVRREVLREARAVPAEDAADRLYSEPPPHEATVAPASLARPVPPPPAHSIPTERAKERSTSGPARPPIEVRIGTIEIRGPQAPAPAATVEKSPVQPAVPPEGFDAYRGMRAYQGWWRGA